MTTRPRTKAQAAQRATRALAVLPLLIVCCLVLSGYMGIGYMFLHEGATTQGTAQPDQTTPVTEEPQSSSGEIPQPVEQVVVSEYVSISASAEVGRETNLRLAAEALNGYIIEPGATFSFNEVVGDVETDDRYQLAPEINGNELIYGRGGGICQVSSALYLASLSTELRVVERHPHTVVVDYVPMGLDATVVHGMLDFKLANDSADPVTLSAVAEGQMVTLKILGAPLEDGLKIQPVSHLLEHHEAGDPLPNTVEWSAELESTTYYIIEARREYYRNGEKIEDTLLSEDRYTVLADTTVRMPDGGGTEPTK